jgi:hypothetical protein
MSEMQPLMTKCRTSVGLALIWVWSMQVYAMVPSSDAESSIASNSHAIVDQAGQDGNHIISNSASDEGDHDSANYGTEEIFVGHDADEAMTTADIVLCMADKSVDCLEPEVAADIPPFADFVIDLWT